MFLPSLVSQLVFRSLLGKGVHCGTPITGRVQHLLQDNKEQRGFVRHFWHELMPPWHTHSFKTDFLLLYQILLIFAKAIVARLLWSTWASAATSKDDPSLLPILDTHFCIFLVLDQWTRAGSWSCWNLNFSMCGWVHVQCSPELVHCAVYK